MEQNYLLQRFNLILTCPVFEKSAFWEHSLLFPVHVFVTSYMTREIKEDTSVPSRRTQQSNVVPKSEEKKQGQDNQCRSPVFFFIKLGSCYILVFGTFKFW